MTKLYTGTHFLYWPRFLPLSWVAFVTSLLAIEERLRVRVRSGTKGPWDQAGHFWASTSNSSESTSLDNNSTFSVASCTGVIFGL